MTKYSIISHSEEFLRAISNRKGIIFVCLLIFGILFIGYNITRTSLFTEKRSWQHSQKHSPHSYNKDRAKVISIMDHSQMDHSLMDHSNHSGMDQSDKSLLDIMDHGGMMMDNGAVDHSTMDHGSMNMDHMMKMYFHFGTTETILFSFWKTNSWQGMLGSCVAVFVMAALYEGLKVGRELLLRRAMATTSYTVQVQTTDESQAMTGETRKQLVARSRLLSCSHFLQTLLHIVQIVVSYFLMLIFMTYNVWLCIATAAGAGTGYFAFSWKRAVIVDVNEHCH